MKCKILVNRVLNVELPEDVRDDVGEGPGGLSELMDNWEGHEPGGS